MFAYAGRRRPLWVAARIRTRRHRSSELTTPSLSLPESRLRRRRLHGGRRRLLVMLRVGHDLHGAAPALTGSFGGSESVPAVLLVASSSWGAFCIAAGGSGGAGSRAPSGSAPGRGRGGRGDRPSSGSVRGAGDAGGDGPHRGHGGAEQEQGGDTRPAPPSGGIPGTTRPGAGASGWRCGIMTDAAYGWPRDGDPHGRPAPAKGAGRYGQVKRRVWTFSTRPMAANMVKAWTPP